jgi:transforming growth factor-beta-induced protein
MAAIKLVRTVLSLALVVLSSTASVACDDDESTTSTPTPAPSGTGTGSGTSGGAPAAEKDIIATAEGAGQFGTLVAAVRAADLEATLKGAGPFTVFAPTDDAFKALPPGTVEDLLKPENKAKLTAILTYHVVAGSVPSSEAVKLSTAKTVNGKDLTLSTANGGLEVNGAKVVTADVKASNGIIHIIDKVIIPAE